MKRLWPNLKLYPRICMDRLGKITKKVCENSHPPGCNFNLGRSKIRLTNQVAQASDPYSADLWFEFWPEHRLSWLILFVTKRIKECEAGILATRLRHSDLRIEVWMPHNLHSFLNVKTRNSELAPPPVSGGQFFLPLL
jgi:hypothetical protein